MSDQHWDDLLHKAEVYGGLTYESREHFSSSPRAAWAWLTTQLDAEGWKWSVTSGYSQARATVEGAGNHIYARKGKTPLVALMAAYCAAAKAAREAGIPQP